MQMEINSTVDSVEESLSGDDGWSSDLSFGFITDYGNTPRFYIKRFESKFWRSGVDFVPTVPEPAKLEVTSAQVTHVPRSIQRAFTNSFEASKAKLVKTLMAEIIPVELSVIPAINDVLESVSLLLDVPLDELRHSFPYRHLVTSAIDIRVLQVVCEALKLDAKTTAMLVERAVAGDKPLSVK